MTDEWHQCTALVDGKRCTWEGTGTPALCHWHAVDIASLGPLDSGDPRAQWAVVTFQGIEKPPEGQRWAITASYGASYWAKDAEAEAYAARERVRGAHRGVACVVVRIASLTDGRDFEYIVRAAGLALELGSTRVV